MNVDRIREHHEYGDGTEIFCPLNAVLNLLSERWTLHVVHALMPGKRRFNEIARETGVNPSTLRERLRALEDEGIVSRTVVSTMPPNVEYALTEKGLALNGVMEEMAGYARQWMKPKGVELVDEAEACPSPAGASRPQ